MNEQEENQVTEDIILVCLIILVSTGLVCGFVYFFTQLLTLL